MLSIDLSQINRGETIGVALSGGRDSVCLLHCLLSARESLGFSLCVINVEHGIRGEASKSDTEFCRRLAASYDLPFFTFSVDAPALSKKQGLSIEEAARILRYDCFFKCIKSGVCDKVAVAHHLSDRVETILFNLLRGSSLSGAKGFSDAAREGRIIRPLLNVSSEEVGLYVDKHALSFVVDETNSDEELTRNALRKSVIPKIKELFPKFENSLVRFADLAQSDDEYLYSLAASVLKESGDGFSFSIFLPYSVFSRCVILALKKLGVKKDYEKIHADDVFSLKSAISGKKITLPKGIFAVKEHDEIVIRPKTVGTPEPVPFSLGKTIFNGFEIVCEMVDPAQVRFGDGLYFDGDKLPYNAVFRTKRVGDTFQKFGGGTVSLKKYLTDLKFPESKKSSTPLIAADKTVLCVCEKDVSLSIKIDKSTVNIIKLVCKKLQTRNLCTATLKKS